MTRRRERLLVEQQLAVALRCEVTALQRMRMAGVGPSYLVLPSGIVIYRESDVLAWLNGARRPRDRHR